MIVLIDLDNTLVDRRAAFDTWVSAFVAEIGGTDADTAWLLAEDRDGYQPRAALAQAVLDRFQLTSTPGQLVDRLLYEHVDLIELLPGVRAGLDALAAGGARIVVVTNGTVAQQTAKLLRTGLQRHLDDVVISEAVGVKKPDPRIFAAAIRQAIVAGGSGSTWMIGDHPTADIAGARDCGLQTGWVSHRCEWTADWSPTITGRTTVEVFDLLLQLAPTQ